MIIKGDNIRLIVADSQEKQLEIKNDFQDLFKNVFDKDINDVKWMHYYVNNQLGVTVSFAMYDEDIMVGHGGIIPQRLKSKGGNRVNYFLQTAVMFRKEYQNLALFKELMDTISNYVKKNKTFVLAFPNAKSYLPFVKLLGWKLVTEYSIKQFSMDKKNQSLDVDCSEAGTDYTYEIEKSEDFKKWRGELNNLRTMETGEFSLIYKEYEGNLEILDISIYAKDTLIPASQITERLGYRKVNIPECFFDVLSLDHLAFSATVGIPQKMCFWPAQFGGLQYREIKPSMLLSDIF